jgi:hypothetical protein
LFRARVRYVTYAHHCIHACIGDDQHEGSSREQAVLSEAANAQGFIRTIQKILTHRRDEVGTMSFSKDDDDIMDFVTYAANLRMANFGTHFSPPCPPSFLPFRLLSHTRVMNK